MSSNITFNNIKVKTLSTLQKCTIYRYCPVSAIFDMPDNTDIIDAGTTVTIIAMNHSARTNTLWYMVNYNSKVGWINNGLNNSILNVVFIEQNSSNSSGMSMKDLYQYKYIKDTNLIIKADCIIWDRLPITSAAGRVETINTGSKVNIIDMGYSSLTATFWYKVAYGKNNSTGWINNGNTNNKYLVVDFDSNAFKTAQNISNSVNSTMDKSLSSSKKIDDDSSKDEENKKNTEITGKVNRTLTTSKKLSAKLDEIYNKRKNELENLVLANGVEYSPNHNSIWYNRFDRFGVVNPYNALMGNCKEYLFFVKPDLNIVYTNGANKRKLHNNLKERAYFLDLLANNPEAVNALQFSLNKTPFIPVLTNAVSNTLQIQNLEADVIEGPSNIYGTKIDYRGSSYKSDEDISFSLEFKDDEYKGIYQLFKAYDKYESLKLQGLLKFNFDKKNLSVDDQRMKSYTQQKILHDRFGIYKIVVGSDGETIVYYAYICGAMPMNVPRDAFSEIEPGKRIVYNIDWKASFIEDNDPMILYEFQQLCNMIMPPKDELARINWYINSKQRMSGKRARCPGIEVCTDSDERRHYKLAWYYNKETDGKDASKGGLFDV